MGARNCVSLGAMSKPERLTEDAAQDAFAAIVNKGRGDRGVEDYEAASPARLGPERAEAWSRDGYFIVRALEDPAFCSAVNDAAIAQVRDMEANGVLLQTSRVKDGAFTIAEQNLSQDVENAEEKASKLYNLHRRGLFRDFAHREALVELLAGVVGDDVGVFNSQFIFKNPGAWGQPWHQDSLYFQFDRFPQVGVWLATSRATPETGCLYVLPGSHREPLHEHLPDSRPGANYGYVEIRDQDFAGAVPIEMETGDVLIFHSFLMHRSVDNVSDQRRTALVYHCGALGTKWRGVASPTVDWVPVCKEGVRLAPPEKPDRAPWSVRFKLGLGVLVFRVMGWFKKDA